MWQPGSARDRRARSRVDAAMVRRGTLIAGVIAGLVATAGADPEPLTTVAKPAEASPDRISTDPDLWRSADPLLDLDAAGLSRAMTRRARALWRRCRGLPDQVRVGFLFDRASRISGVRVLSPEVAPTAATCLAHEVRRWRLPRRLGRSIVGYAEPVQLTAVLVR